jgi:hypothetical protein
LKPKERLWSNALIVLTIFAVGAGLIIWPLRPYLSLATAQIRAGRELGPLIAGIAYVLGFFVTRTVQDCFEAIFAKPPFSDIGAESAPGKEKHPAWVDSMLKPLGYLLFLGWVASIIAALVLLLWLGLWLVGSAAAHH